MKSKKNIYEIYQEIRRDWGQINPSTKVFKDKKNIVEKKNIKRTLKNKKV